MVYGLDLLGDGIDAAKMAKELIEAKKRQREAEARLRKIQEEERARVAAELAAKQRVFRGKIAGTRHMSAGQARTPSQGNRMASAGMARIAKSV